MREEVQVYVGIGSNLKKEITIKRAVQVMQDSFGELTISTIYATRAVGIEGPDFLNLVVGFKTSLSPTQLADKLRQIEFAHGRQDPAERHSPRTLDLDLLLYGDRIIDEDGVRVPRRDVTEYPFVLGPLAELAPDAVHPQLGSTYRELWSAFAYDPADMKKVNLNLDLESVADED